MYLMMRAIGEMLYMDLTSTPLSTLLPNTLVGAEILLGLVLLGITDIPLGM